MDEDIKFLQDFLAYDRYRIAELVDSHSILPSLKRLGQLLREHFKGPFIVPYLGENDTMYELIQLLDGNNFEVQYGFTYLTFEAAKITPIYTETIEVQCVQEFDSQSYSTTTTYTGEQTLDLPELRNPPRRGLRAKMPLIDDISFDEKLFDEFLKPP